MLLICLTNRNSFFPFQHDTHFSVFISSIFCRLPLPFYEFFPFIYFNNHHHRTVFFLLWPLHHIFFLSVSRTFIRFHCYFFRLATSGFHLSLKQKLQAFRKALLNHVSIKCFPSLSVFAKWGKNFRCVERSKSVSGMRRIRKVLCKYLNVYFLRLRICCRCVTCLEVFWSIFWLITWLMAWFHWKQIVKLWETFRISNISHSALYTWNYAAIIN